MSEFEIVVLGGGPGGYVAAIRAAQLGFKTAVIDKGNLGGICLNWGCIPTKALLKNAEVLESIKNANEFGIKIENYSVDFSKIIKRSRDISERISKNVEMLMKKNKIERFRNFGKIVSKNQIDLFNENNEKVDSIKFGKLIIATGASPKIFPSIPVDRKKIITSTEAMILPELPKEMIIIGAGAIGIEFAYFYNVLGTKVTIIELLENILPVEDKEVSETLEKIFKKKGITIHTKTKVEKAEVKGEKVEVIISKNDKQEILSADVVLSAIGVSGNISGYGLEELGIEIEKGHIKVNKSNYQTNIENIYAIGDVIGPPWLAHVASAEGIYCVEKIKGLNPHPIDYNNIPGCTYCHPQVTGR